MPKIVTIAGTSKVRAFSLLETVIGLGMLVATLAVFFRLYHMALTYSGGTDREILATNVAQRQMALLRGWSADPSSTGRGFDDWTDYTDVTFPDQEFPEYQVRIRSDFVPAVSPGSGLVVEPAGPGRKTLENTLRRVQLTVSWGQESLSLVSLVADPPRQLRDTNPVVVEGPGGPVARGAPIEFTVKVFDISGQQIPDVMAKWYVKPIDGAGTITSGVEGESATFVNISKKANGGIQYTGGQCRVTARVVYRGVEAWGESEILDLAP